MNNPFKGLLRSRKFLLVAIDAGAAVTGLVAARYLPESQDFIIALVATLQPVFVAAIVGIAWEDAAAKKAGTHPSQAYDFQFKDKPAG